MNLRKICFAIWGLAFAVRMVLIFGFHRTEFGGPEPVRAAARIRESGELTFERDHLRQAIAWIEGHPRSFLRLTVERMVNFWFPPLSHPIHRYAVWALTLAAWCGLIYLARVNREAAVMLGSLLASFPLIYYLVQNYLRYWHPIYWALLLLAAAPISAVFYPSRSTVDRARTPRI